MPKLRYVILHHTGYGEPHYDLMVEAEPDGPLLTWRLPQWPDVTDAMAIERLKDHRRDYLTYEGPVSGDRGSVKRVESGECDLVTRGRKHPSFGLLFADGTTIHIGHVRLKGKHAKNVGPLFITGTRVPNAQVSGVEDPSWLPEKPQSWVRSVARPDCKSPSNE